MRVLLVYPSAKEDGLGRADVGAVAEPIALEYLGAGAKGDGHDVRLLDLRLHPRGLDEALAGFRPDVVGVTGMSMHVLRAREVCRRAKEAVPSCATVVGGHHASLEPADFFEPEVDLVVVGEGVRPLRRILAAMTAGSPVADLPGVWSRAGGGWRWGGEQEDLDLDDLPFPDRSLTAADRHLYGIDWMRPIALVRTTAGCPFRCRFCSLWRLSEGRYLKRRVETVVAELRTLDEPSVFFVDDEAFVDARRMRALGEAIERAGIEKSYFAYARIDSLLRDLDLMRSWRRIGLSRLFVGFESVVDGELDAYGKRQTRDDVVRALAAAREIGIHLFSNFIVDPAWTPREFDALVRFVEENDVAYPAFTVLTPIPGCGLSLDDVVPRQPNGRPRWDLFDLQHAVTPTRMPPDAFAAAYEGLYRRFASRHLSSVREPSAGPATPEEEVRRHGESPYRAPVVPAPVLPLDEEPHVAAWREYRDAAGDAPFAFLQERLAQLAIPVRPGVSETPAYRRAMRRGEPPSASDLGGRLRLEEPAALRLSVEAHPAGALPVLATPCRRDFETLLFALAHRHEPRDVLPSVNAQLVSSLVNWDRLGRYRREWLARQGRLDAVAAWPAEMARIAADEPWRAYDRLLLVCDRPYGGVEASVLGLPMSREEWLARSRVLRVEHEMTHYATKRLFGVMRSNVLDELLADVMGATRALGGVEARWLLLFLGLEEHPRVREDGRFHAYTAGLSPAAKALLAEVTARAAAGAEALARRSYRQPDRARFFLALASLGLADLAGDRRESLFDAAWEAAGRLL